MEFKLRKVTLLAARVLEAQILDFGMSYELRESYLRAGFS